MELILAAALASISMAAALVARIRARTARRRAQILDYLAHQALGAYAWDLVQDLQIVSDTVYADLVHLEAKGRITSSWRTFPDRPRRRVYALAGTPADEDGV